MAYIYFSSIDSTSFRVRVRGLDSSYNQSERWVTFELYRGSRYEDYYTITLPNQVTQSDYVTFKNLIPDTKYTVEVTIGNIGASGSKVYLDDYVWTDPLEVIEPRPYLWTSGIDYLDIEWDSTGADSYGYELYKGSTRIEWGTTTRVDRYFDGLDPDTKYTFYVWSIVGSQTSTEGVLTAYTDPLDYPSFSIYDNTETSIIILVYKESVATSYRVYVDGVYDGNMTQPSGSYGYYDIYGLTPGRNYSIRVSSVSNGVEGPLSPATSYYTLYPYPDVTMGATSGTSATITWNAISGATRYYVYLNGVSQGYVTSRSYTFSNLTPLTEYNCYVRAYNGYVYSNTTLILTIFKTVSNRPTNWAWEYTILSGQSFYTQSGSTVYIMRASHWNAFTARINEFRLYKLGPGNAYSFTTAVTSHTESQIRACVNQAITAINAMGFSQSSVSSGGDVAASTFTTMRNNLNSIT